MAKNEVCKYVRINRHVSREKVFRHIKEVFGYEVIECRLYSKGGVGSCYWMKRNRCYRVQVGASKIDTKKFSYPYAMCVNIY